MSFMDSSSDDDCYVNSVKALKAMKKKLVVTASPIDKGSSPSPKDSVPSCMLEECVLIEAPLVQRTRSSTRRGRRNTRRNVNYQDSEAEENVPEFFAKQKPIESISLIDSDSDDLIVPTIHDDQDTTVDDADNNYEMAVKFKWQSGKIEKFPMRRYQEFSKMFDYFSAKANVPQERIRFFKDKLTIQPSDTPDSLGITIVDILDGGIIDSIQSEYQPVNTHMDEDSINIKIQTKDQKKSLTMSIRKTQKIKVLIMKCAEQLLIPEEKIKFQFDGDPVYPNETPESLDLEGGECFDMYMIP